MKIEQLIPQGFQLVMYGNVRGEGENQVNTVVCNLVTNEAIKFANDKALEQMQANKDTDSKELDKIKINALRPLVSSETVLPEIASPAHEDLIIEATKVSFISQFLGKQLQLISDVQKRQDGLQPIHNTAENSKGKEANGEEDKRKVRKLQKES